MKLLIAIAILSVVGSLASAAQAAEPSRDELLTQIAELKSRVESLEQQQARTVSAHAVDNTVVDVLQDADKRSQLLASDQGALAGYDTMGFFIRSGNDFVLRPGAQFQFRYVTAWRNDDDEADNGFEVRRARLTLNGSVFTPDLTYCFSWQSNRSTGSAFLEDAIVMYRFAPRWTIKGGQFKDPVYHEELVGDVKQMAVERSMLNELIGGTQTGRMQGVAIAYGDATGPLRAELAAHDGTNSINTPFVDVAADFGVGARTEYKLAGNWGDYGDLTSFHNKADMLVVGAGGDFTRGDAAEISRATIDVQWENTSGFGAYGALLGTHADLDDADDRFDCGALVQAGQMLGRRWQVFARYDFVKLDAETAGGEDLFHEITGGVNWFLGNDGIAGNRAKLTLDILYLPNGAPADLPGIGVLASDGETEVVLRAQFTLAV